MKEITGYQCDYCNYKSAHKWKVESHEETCPHDPKLKRCHTCRYVNPEDWNDDKTGLPQVRATRKCKMGEKQRFHQGHQLVRVGDIITNL